MEIRQLHTFIQVAQFQSFSKAAESMGYSQSAVTVQIKLLEDELGIRLFDRKGKRIVLTSKGTRFLENAYKIVYEVQKSIKDIGDTGELTGELSIGVTESLGQLLPPVLSHFRSLYPKVSVRILMGSPSYLLEKMDHWELDLVCILDEARFHNDWKCPVKKKEEIVFVASSDLNLGNQLLTVKELIQYPLFLTEREANYRRALDQYLASREMNIKPVVEVGEISFILKMLELNSGVSFLPYYAVEEGLKSGKLTLLQVTDFQTAMYRQVFYHKGRWKSREMEAFIALLKRSVENH